MAKSLNFFHVVLFLILLTSSSNAYRLLHRVTLSNIQIPSSPYSRLYHSDSADLFGTSSTSDSSSKSTTAVHTDKEVKNGEEEGGRITSQMVGLKDEAAKLRKEAAALEIAMREEARAKGVPEDMINKLIPLSPAKKATAAAPGGTALQEKQSEEGSVKVMNKVFTFEEIRSKLGYLNTGDAVRMTTELDRIKQKGVLQYWNSQDLSKATFKANTLQFKSKTNIDPIKLKLDDVGFNYQNVLIAALFFATVFGFGSTFVGGQLGFILGYASALVPVTLVGLGSIAPALIGDILNRSRYLIDKEAKDKFVKMNAGKFLVGYTLGLPVARFKTGGFSNEADFFQIRPKSGNAAVQDKQMFARNQFKQSDIARSSVVCIAGSVAECIFYGEGTGTNANDVNTLYELVNAVEPRLKPEQIQDHVRWSAVTAYELIDSKRDQFQRVCEAFEAGLPLEECIAILESKD